MLSFQAEPFKINVEELKPLTVLNYREIEGPALELPFDVNWDLYFDLEAEGKLVYVTARDDKELVGYMVGFVAPSTHSKDAVFLLCDCVYLAPEHRNLANFRQMLGFIEVYSLEKGCTHTMLGTKMTRDIGFLYQHFGYKMDEVLYVKKMEARNG